MNLFVATKALPGVQGKAQAPQHSGSIQGVGTVCAQGALPFNPAAPDT